MNKIESHNRTAWDREVQKGNPATRPVKREALDAARNGQIGLSVTDHKCVPANWLPPLKGCRVLVLAGGGGQQGPLLAAAGAQVLVLDNSAQQLARDEAMARQHQFDLKTHHGTMCALDGLGLFDMIVLPLSNQFIPDLAPLWAAVFDALAPGGRLLAGFINPVDYSFDPVARKQDVLTVRYALPWSDLTSITKKERDAYWDAQDPYEFGHTLEAQLGGILNAGMVVRGFFEDKSDDVLGRYMATYFAVWAQKMNI